MKRATEKYLDTAEAEVLASERSQAVRTAGLSGATDFHQTSAGLADQYLKRNVPVMIKRRNSEDNEIKADAVHCPRCHAITVRAKLTDDTEIYYCSTCRFPIPFPKKS